MLILGEGSSLQAELIDKSSFSLAAYSNMVPGKAVYDSDQTSRDTFLSLVFGKARFLATKLMGGQDEDFKVKTPTAFIGVSGSDFALSVAPVKDLTASAKTNWFAELLSVKKAHAAEAPGDALATTVVTGDETSVNFSGDVGPAQVVGPNSASRAIAGMAALVPVVVAAIIAIEALGAVG